MVYFWQPLRCRLVLLFMLVCVDERNLRLYIGLKICTVLIIAGPASEAEFPRTLGNNVTVTAVELNLLQLDCIMNYNSYYSNLGGKSSLVLPVNNTQPSAEDCCISCHEQQNCNAWVWCPLENGCSIPSTIRKPKDFEFPFKGCELLRIQAFSPYDDRFSTDFKITGTDIPFVSGSPLNISVPSLPDYQVLVGVDLAGKNDYECASVGTSPCLLRASADDVGAACNSDPECQGFVFFPQGINFDGTGPVGVLKKKDDGVISRADTEVDPTAATYIKRSLAEEDSSSEDSGNGSTITIAVVASVGGVILIAGIAGSILYVRRYRQLSRSFPDTEGDNGLNDNAKASDLMNIKHSELDAIHEPYASRRKDSGSSSDSGISYLGRGETSQFHKNNIGHESKFGTLSVVEITELPAGPPPESLLRMFSSHDSQGAGELLEVFSAGHNKKMNEDDLASHVRRSSKIRDSNADGRGSHSPSPNYSFRSSEDTTPRSASNSAVDRKKTNEVTISPRDVEICQRADGSFWELGAGAFGRVFKGRYRSKYDVAVKVLNPLDDPRSKEAVVREVALLRDLRHRNIVRLIGACLDGPGGTALLLTELMDLGDLWRALPARTQSGDRIFSWWLQGRYILEDIARGLAYLHAQRVVHFDLKSANILLNRNGTAKLADIGMARVLCKSYFSVISGLGTFAWSAPEVLAGRRCSEMADMYSFGVVLWEICTGEPPVRGHMRPLEPGKDCPPEIVELHYQCISEDPEKRPSAQEVVSLLATLSS